MILFGHENALLVHVVLDDPNWQDKVPDLDDYVQNLPQHSKPTLSLENIWGTKGRLKNSTMTTGPIKSSIRSVTRYGFINLSGRNVWVPNWWHLGSRAMVFSKLDDVNFCIKSGPQARPLMVHANHLMPYRGWTHLSGTKLNGVHHKFLM